MISAEQIALLSGQFAAIVGAEYVQVSTANDAVDGCVVGLVVAPENADQVARVLKYAAEAGVAVVVRGGGTKLGWGNPPASADVLLETGRMAAVLEHAWGDMTVTVQAGCTIANMQRTLAEHGQRLALDPLWPERATVGGVLATNDTGALRVRYGALRDQVIGMTIALADGTVAKSGGKVVKNVAGYDLPKLMTGALGTLGVIVEANFRLYPLPQATRDLTLAVPDMQAANQALLAVNDSVLAPGAVQLRVGTGLPPQIDLRFEGLPAALDAQERQLGQMIGIAPQPSVSSIWQAREQVWLGTEPALVCKLSLLPSDIARFTTLLERLANLLRLDWHMVINALGVGMLRLVGANDEVLLAGIVQLRTDVASMQGSISILGCSPGIKRRIEVWGDVGDGLALMRRVKERFDPQRTLSPGRFVGRI
ncbi:MAG: FAD-binding oxidoreductase [Roseiflexaceae bacterium]|nr:FAD-binding oxidoreductase [Roseiflexaceae bacterium]